jgi:hypothetical protein
MSLDLSQRLKVFLASAPQSIWTIQTFQFSHSAMSQVFNLWREPYVGVTFDGGLSMTMSPCNIEMSLAGSPVNLDQVFNIKLGLVDINDTFRQQMKLIPLTTTEKVQVVYREYLSDDLTTPQASVTLQMESISYQIGAANITAVSPRLSMLRTGELYTTRDVPMLRGLL